MRILVTGATGFIGKALVKELQKEKHIISIIARNKKKVKNKSLTIYESADEISKETVFNTVINLAGAPISKRWTEKYKKEIIDSRIDTTRDIYKLAARLEKPPEILISASATGYYGNQGSKTIHEESNPTIEFTHSLCKSWEEEALNLKKFNTKVITIRLGVVLGRNGGILQKTAPIFKLNLGGQIGTGQQYLSWIHIYDLLEAVKFFLAHEAPAGAYNLTAPAPVTNKQWTQSLATALKRSARIPLPELIVKTMFGEMGASLLLNGQKVIPKKLLTYGTIQCLMQ